MEYTPVNLKEKLSKFSEHWTPKIVAQMNDRIEKIDIEGVSGIDSFSGRTIRKSFEKTAGVGYQCDGHGGFRKRQHG